MAKRKMYEFTVEGTRPFPVDMLRYDACWPRTSSDAIDIALGCDSRIPRSELDHPRSFRITLLCSDHGPTEGRWRSFGWKIAETRSYSLDV